MGRTIDKLAVMRDAHRRFRDGRRLGLGWSFGQCLRTAWAAARIRRDTEQWAPAPALSTRQRSSLARTAPGFAEQAQRAPSSARRGYHSPAHPSRTAGPSPGTAGRLRGGLPRPCLALVTIAEPRYIRRHGL
ncbi:hypothetical protein AMST5_01877 [freshwater sediment metagenome]|uniref:Uncharacterized protein n=1 Tax=freshwater sediment metagenome TaxID=556182 RepID=A0AA48M024_9ZZZZ